MTITFFF